MPVTRSSRKEKQPSKETDESSVEQDASSTARQNSSRRSSRDLRRKRRDDLKSKTTGVGLGISSTKATSKRIIFDDAILSEQEGAVEDDVPITKDDASVASDDSDDDDAIEEVKSSVARDKAIEQLALERETIKVQKLQTRTKKRKKKVQEEKDFDEEFFAQVDVEMAEQRKQKKMKESTPLGRHTSFLSTEEEMDSSPIQADHNIELVVLGDAGAEKNQVSTAQLQRTEDKTGMEPSEASHLFARGRLASGKTKRKGSNKKKKDPGWKRSKKMNVLAFGRAKVKRGRGMAAANFVVKT